MSDGTLIVALAAGGTTVTVLDGTSASIRATIEVGRAPWNAVARGVHMYVAMHTEGADECLDAVQVVDCLVGEIVATVPLEAESRPKLVVPAFEHERLYAINSGNGSVTEIDTNPNAAIRSAWVGDGPQYGQRWQGMLYVANGQSNDVAFIDEATLSVTHRVAVGSGPERCVVYKDHDQVWTNNLDDDTVSVVSISLGVELARIDVGRGPIRITPWDSRGRDEWAVLCRGSQARPAGEIVFIDSGSLRVTDSLALQGHASNWNWGLGARHQTVYVTLADEPVLVVVDAARLQVIETVRLSTQPEPAGFGPSIYVSKSGGVFVASRDSVTLLTQE